MKNVLVRTELKIGSVYRISARNFGVGVYAGNNGVIGIREKFGDEYLFTEYLFEAGPPFGTVRPYELLGQIPDGIELTTSLGTYCGECNGRAWWTGPPSPAPWACEGECDETMPSARPNQDLFNALKEYEEEI